VRVVDPPLTPLAVPQPKPWLFAGGFLFGMQNACLAVPPLGAFVALKLME
jgi:hypothetical protein